MIVRFDASLYLEDGTQMAHSENVTVKERLGFRRAKSGGSFNHQLVVPVPGKDKAQRLLRLTLDTHQLVTESSQVDNDKFTTCHVISCACNWFCFLITFFS